MVQSKFSTVTRHPFALLGLLIVLFSSASLSGNEPFRRGDVNLDGSIDIADGITILGVLFSGGAPLACENAGDTNDDEHVDIADAISLLATLFSGGAPLASPGPQDCGLDPTPGSLTCDTLGPGCSSIGEPIVYQRARARVLARLSSEVYENQSIGQDMFDGWVVEDIVTSLLGTYAVVVSDSATGDLAVVFRGTEITVADILVDVVAIPSGSFHSGFLASTLLVVDELAATLAAHANPASRVFFTGHSLGGANATIASYLMADDLQALGYPPSNVILYSMAAPRSITSSLSPTFESKVPHSYAVANLDDPVPLVPAGFGYIQIENMIVQSPGVHSYGTRDGSQYAIEMVSNPATHKIGRYRWRLGTDEEPTLDLTINSTGHFRLNWNSPDRKDAFANDWVALYHGYPTDPDNFLPVHFANGLFRFSWDDADPGNSGTSGNHNTGYAKGNGFYIAYVEQEGLFTDPEIVHVEGPFTPSTPSVWGTIQDNFFFDWFVLNWSVPDPGANDFVALYNGNPYSLGADNYVFLQWDWALDPSGYVTQVNPDSGYWIGYVMEDDFGNQTILDAEPMP